MVQGEFYTVVKDEKRNTFAVGYIGNEGKFIALAAGLDRKAIYYIMEGCSKWLDSMDEEDGSPSETTKVNK